MSPGTLELETDDFVFASRVMGEQIGMSLAVGVDELTGALAGCAAMAGDDPGGQQWANAYDPAARAAVAAGVDLVNACYQLAAMFERTAHNYEAADAASTPAVHAREAAQLGSLLPMFRYAAPGYPPRAAGGSGGLPTGWGVIEAAGHVIWPNGHQDRLHAAAAAWRTSAGVLTERAGQVNIAALGLRDHGLPEGPDVLSVCTEIAARMHELAAVHRDLGHACDALAAHIDHAHHEVISELEDLLAWTAAIQAAGGLFSVVTLGASEGVAQGVETARIAKTAAAVAGVLEEFTGLVRSLAASIAPLLSRAGAVSARLRAVLGVKLSIVSVDLIDRYPMMLMTVGKGRAALVRLGEITDRFVLPGVRDPKTFDPESLRGMSMGEVRQGVPPGWTCRPASDGKGIVYIDPAHKYRQIRIMEGYPKGSRPGQINWGPYVVVSQNGAKLKIPLKGNPEL